MHGTYRVTPDVTVGPQPSVDDLRQLAMQGFKSVVNFRTDGEPDQALSPEDEARRARDHGLKYVHIPVSMKAMRPNLVDEFRSKYEDLPKPVFAHCKSGKRAGAMVVMQIACEKGWNGEQTLAQAEEIGFQCDQPELQKFVKNYCDGHCAPVS